ncbi:hypothetical protein D3C72_1435780 [compost metagenome]
MATGLDLGVIAHTAQQAVGDTWSATRAARDLPCPVGGAVDGQDGGRATHDAGQLFDAVELQALDDTEAVAQRRGQQTGAGGGADQGERRQIDLDRARRRALADHDVDLEIFHRRVQHFLHHRRQAMDLVDEQHIVRLQVGQQRGQVAGLFDHRAGGHAQGHAQFVGDDMAEGGLAQAGRAEDQHVVQRIATTLGGLDVDLHLLAHRHLAEVVGKSLGSDAGVGGVILAGGAGGDDAVVGHVLIMRQKRGDSAGLRPAPAEAKATATAEARAEAGFPRDGGVGPVAGDAASTSM